MLSSVSLRRMARRDTTWLNTGFGIPLTVLNRPCGTRSHQTSSAYSRGGFGCTSDRIVTDLGLGISRSDEQAQAQACVGVGVVSGCFSVVQPSSKLLAGIETGVGARRIEGFNLCLNLDGLQPGPDRHRTRPSLLSSICLDHPFVAQRHGPSPSGPSRSDQLLASMLDRGPEEPSYPHTPPPRPRAPSPAHRHCPVTDRMPQLARARTAPIAWSLARTHTGIQFDFAVAGHPPFASDVLTIASFVTDVKGVLAYAGFGAEKAVVYGHSMEAAVS